MPPELTLVGLLLSCGLLYVILICVIAVVAKSEKYKDEDAGRIDWLSFSPSMQLLALRFIVGGKTKQPLLMTILVIERCLLIAYVAIFVWSLLRQ
jgi:hypothetical protein